MALEQSGDMTSAFSSALESASAASEASPASTPVEQSQPTETPTAAAIAQPEAPTQTPESVSPEQQADAKGEPPKWRWQDILANARETATKEAEARVRQEVEQQYAGLKDFTSIGAEERNGLLIWRAALNGDQRAIAHIRAYPQALDAIRGLVAEQSKPQADHEPEADLQAPDGTLVYSAQKQREWREWNNRQLTSTLRQEWQKEMQPLQHVAQTMQEQQAHARAMSEVGTVLNEFRADPDFKTHEADVKAELAKDERLAALADRDPKQALEIAYGRVWKAKVLPTREQKSEAQVLANLQQRAVAGTVNPNAAATTTPKKFQPGQQGFVDALAHFAGDAR